MRLKKRYEDNWVEVWLIWAGMLFTVGLYGYYGMGGPGFYAAVPVAGVILSLIVIYGNDKSKDYDLKIKLAD